MRYIRRKDDPLVVKAFGYVEPGGLGEFDPDVYEEMEGHPPEGHVVEPFLTVPQQLDALFMQQPVEARVAFYGLKAAVKAALESNDYEAAHFMIAGASVQEDQKPVQEKMLTLLQKQLKKSS